ncbi:hypothetical protein JCM9957A_12350 [Kineosporia succinea]
MILHLDLDAFFSAVEQLHKPSLRGKPVIVGGTGRRGVVSTASYEARKFGVGSAMSIVEARRRCPNAAYLTPRFQAYRAASRLVMGHLAELSPLVEQMSVDEAYVDLTPTMPDIDVEGVTELAQSVRRRIRETTGLTASVGAGTSKLIAKIGSDLNKPDGLTVVAPGTERELLASMPVRKLPGIGPATQERLHKYGMHTVGEVAAATEKEIIGILGQAQGAAVHQHSLGIDNRELEPDRDAKSVSAEETFSTDLTDRRELMAHARRMAEKVVGRITKDGLCARTITIKVRSYDFSTITRSFTLDQPTDSLNKIMASIRHLLDAVDVSDGVRLLGVGVAGLTDFAQTDLLADLLAELGDDPDEQLPGAVTGMITAGAAPAPQSALTTMDRDSGDQTHDATPSVPGAAARSTAKSTARPAAGAMARPVPAGAAGVVPGEVAGVVPGEAAVSVAEGTTGDGVLVLSRLADVAPEVSGGAEEAYGNKGFGWTAELREPRPPDLGVPEWRPGQDIVHAERGAGWVQGTGLGRVTVRFEGPHTGPGPIKTFRVDDPDLAPGEPPVWTQPAPDPADSPA